MAFTGTVPNPISAANLANLSLTPDHSNYLDTYNFATSDIPDLRAAAIEKYDQTITGFLAKFSTSEVLKGMKYIWSELETKAVSYEDAILDVNGSTYTLTRAASAKVHYRKHEKIQIQTSAGAGIFQVTTVSSATAVVLRTYDADSVTLVGLGTANYTASFTYSLGIEVARDSVGTDFTTGLTRNYSIESNRPTITRDVYAEDGSVKLNLKWVEIGGSYYWYLPEIDDTRERFLEAIEKKLIEGDYPNASSGAYAAGLQGTQGLFAAVEDRGASWGGYLTSIGDLETIIKYYQKVQGAGTNLFLCNQQQEFDFDALGRTFNASYGGSATLENFVGDYNNSESGKILKLGFKGFEYGGYTFLKQGWKYLKEHTFRGNDSTNVVAAARVNFLAVPIGMTPISEGDQNLAYNPVKVQRNYLTKMYTEGRDYDTWTEGGALISPRTNGDDSFKVHFLNESLLCAFNAEKFIISKGNS